MSRKKRGPSLRGNDESAHSAIVERLLLEAAERCGQDERIWRHFLNGLPPPVRRGLLEEWRWQAHGGQREPDGDWTVWLLMAGRGFGKTRAGAEWVSQRAREMPGARIALVGGSREDVERVMVGGPSGLLSVARTGERPSWSPTRGTVSFTTGAQAFAYSAEAAESLRGPEHHFAWCDELAKWPIRRADPAWDNLMMGLRLGPSTGSGRPRVVVTTTPQPVPILNRVIALAGCTITGGATQENVHLPGAFVEWVQETYGGTRLGRQELGGELIQEVEGSLFPRAVLERARVDAVSRAGERDFARIVVGVDPPASVEGTCGIVVCGLDEARVLHVLADLSLSGSRPEGWARAVALAAAAWGADRVIAEKNQGGEMVDHVLRTVEPHLPVRLVSASRGKSARAEPVAALFETGRAKLAGCFRELEDELAGLLIGGGYAGPGASPDRADACVWAMTALMAPQRAPRATAL